jgi:hypothetical protein
MDPITILRWEGQGFLVLLAMVLVYRMLTGKIHLGGLLRRKDHEGAVSPERVQLLLATLALSAKYLGSVLHGTSGSLPDISPQWLYLFGASGGVYASAKAITTLRGN